MFANFEYNLSEDTNVNTSNEKGLTLNALKYIAIIAMVCDHVAYEFFMPDENLYIILRFIGRTTAPIMFFSAVEGYHNTGNVYKYLIRLFVFFLICYIPFALVGSRESGIENFDFFYFNVIYTIFMGVLAIHVRRNVENDILKWVIVFILCILCSTSDWGITGFIIITAFDYYYPEFNKQAFAYILIVIMYTKILSDIATPIDLYLEGEPNIYNFEYYKGRIVSYGMFVPIILLSFYKGEHGAKNLFSKWFFYIFYPAHFVVIYLVSKALGNR